MTKIRGNLFIKSTILLIIGGAITKVVSMFIKIVLARLIGTEGMGIYMLISPTFMLLMALAQLGFPVAISKLVAFNYPNFFNNKCYHYGIYDIRKWLHQSKSTS